MGKMRLTDAGGLDILNTYVAAGGFSLECFTDSGALQDGQAVRELATGGGYAEVDLDLVASAGSLVGGVPTMEWEDVTFTFSGPLTNAVNKTIKGVMLLRGATIIVEQLLAAPYTPANAGDELTISPLMKLGNVPGYVADPA